jgi:hypothetical protein
MKKLVVAILALLYLITSAGATLKLHYCMDKLVDWKLCSNEKPESVCSSCGMAKNEATNTGCCKDEHQQIKLESDHRAADGYQPAQLLQVANPVAVFQFPPNSLPTLTEEKPAGRSHPRSSSLAAYIRNQVFRI